MTTPMNSGHEGWAVIMEEVEELSEEVEEIHSRLLTVWQAVPSTRVHVEMIATAAMARRFLNDLLEETR